MEALLRKSLGVSLSAKPKVQIRPAPPTAMGPLDEDGVDNAMNNLDDDITFVNQDAAGHEDDLAGGQWLDWTEMKRKAGGASEEVQHDEL